jgi:hypothetical protein
VHCLAPNKCANNSACSAAHYIANQVLWSATCSDPGTAPIERSDRGAAASGSGVTSGVQEIVTMREIV